MRQLVTAAFEDAVEQFKADTPTMPLERWNESVFRFLCSRAITARAPEVKQFFECDRIDLVLHRSTERAFVEFKFYVHSISYDPLSGTKNGKKGGPSRQNYRELEKSVEILRRRSASPEVLKFLALFYADPIDTSGRTFDAVYGDGSGVEHKLKTRLLASAGPFSCISSDDGFENVCNARLYEVGT
jgi:hypothetical protein